MNSTVEELQNSPKNTRWKTNQNQKRFRKLLTFLTTFTLLCTEISAVMNWNDSASVKDLAPTQYVDLPNSGIFSADYQQVAPGESLFYLFDGSPLGLKDIISEQNLSTTFGQGYSVIIKFTQPVKLQSLFFVTDPDASTQSSLEWLVGVTTESSFQALITDNLSGNMPLLCCTDSFNESVTEIAIILNSELYDQPANLMEIIGLPYQDLLHSHTGWTTHQDQGQHEYLKPFMYNWTSFGGKPVQNFDIYSANSFILGEAQSEKKKIAAGIVVLPSDSPTITLQTCYDTTWCISQDAWDDTIVLQPGFNSFNFVYGVHHIKISDGTGAQPQDLKISKMALFIEEGQEYSREQQDAGFCIAPYETEHTVIQLANLASAQDTSPVKVDQNTGKIINNSMHLLADPIYDDNGLDCGYTYYSQPPDQALKFNLNPITYPSNVYDGNLVYLTFDTQTLQPSTLQQITIECQPMMDMFGAAIQFSFDVKVRQCKVYLLDPETNTPTSSFEFTRWDPKEQPVPELIISAATIEYPCDLNMIDFDQSLYPQEPLFELLIDTSGLPQNTLDLAYNPLASEMTGPNFNLDYQEYIFNINLSIKNYIFSDYQPSQKQVTFHRYRCRVPQFKDGETPTIPSLNLELKTLTLNSADLPLIPTLKPKFNNECGPAVYIVPSIPEIQFDYQVSKVVMSLDCSAENSCQEGPLDFELAIVYEGSSSIEDDTIKKTVQGVVSKKQEEEEEETEESTTDETDDSGGSSETDSGTDDGAEDNNNTSGSGGQGGETDSNTSGDDSGQGGADGQDSATGGNSGAQDDKSQDSSSGSGSGDDETQDDTSGGSNTDDTGDNTDPSGGSNPDTGDNTNTDQTGGQGEGGDSQNPTNPDNQGDNSSIDDQSGQDTPGGTGGSGDKEDNSGQNTSGQTGDDKETSDNANEADDDKSKPIEEQDKEKVQEDTSSQTQTSAESASLTEEQIAQEKEALEKIDLKTLNPSFVVDKLEIWTLKAGDLGIYVLPELITQSSGALPTIKLIYAPSFVVYDGTRTLKIDQSAISNAQVGIYKISFVLTGDDGLITEVILDLKVEFSETYKEQIGSSELVEEFETTVKGERSEDALVEGLIELGVDLTPAKKDDFSEYDLNLMFNEIVEEEAQLLLIKETLGIERLNDPKIVEIVKSEPLALKVMEEIKEYEVSFYENTEKIQPKIERILIQRDGYVSIEFNTDMIVTPDLQNLLKNLIDTNKDKKRSLYEKKRIPRGIDISILWTPQDTQATWFRQAQESFSWVFKDFTSKDLQIQINFDKPNDISADFQLKDRLKVTFIDGWLFKSTSGLTFQDGDIAIEELPRQTNQADFENSSLVKTTVQRVLLACTAIVLIQIFFVGFKMRYLINVVEVNMTLYLVMLFKIQLPTMVELYFKGISEFARLDFISFQGFIGYLYGIPIGKPYNEHFFALGFDSQITLYNLRCLVFFFDAWIIALIVYIILRQLANSNPRRFKSTKEYLEGLLFFRGTLNFLTIQWVVLMICISLNLPLFDIKSSTGIFYNSMLTVLLTIFALFVPSRSIYVSYKLQKTPAKDQTQNSKNELMEKNYGSLFTYLGGNLATNESHIYLASYFLRPLILLYAILNWSELLYLQFTALFVTFVAKIALITSANPRKYLSVRRLLTEECLILFCGHLTFALGFIQQHQFEDIGSKFVGMILIAISSVHILVNLIAVLASNWSKSKSKAQMNYKKYQERQVQKKLSNVKKAREEMEMKVRKLELRDNLASIISSKFQKKKDIDEESDPQSTTTNAADTFKSKLAQAMVKKHKRRDSQEKISKKEAKNKERQGSLNKAKTSEQMTSMLIREKVNTTSQQNKFTTNLQKQLNRDITIPKQTKVEDVEQSHDESYQSKKQKRLRRKQKQKLMRESFSSKKLLVDETKLDGNQSAIIEEENEMSYEADFRDQEDIFALPSKQDNKDQKGSLDEFEIAVWRPQRTGKSQIQAIQPSGKSKRK